MKSKINPLARANKIVVQELKNDVLIYDLQINKAYHLNETSALVYKLCDGNNSIPAIGKQIAEKIKTPFPDDLVWLAINQLISESLLVDNNLELENKFDGSTRREVIKKVALSSMVALPLVSSLVAPTAAHAQSGTQSCDDFNSCASGLICVNGFCQGCIQEGQNGCNLSEECCSGSICFNNFCQACIQDGQGSCSFNEECCNGLICSSQNTCSQCIPANTFGCFNSSDCCAGLECAENTCYQF